jgi:hypothetical protein
MFHTNDSNARAMNAGMFRLIASEVNEGATHASAITACCIGDDDQQFQINFRDFSDLLEFVLHHKPAEILAPRGSRLQRMIDEALSGSAPHTLH